MSLTTPATSALQRTSDPHGFLYLLTITGGEIVEPVRLVNDTRDLVSDGETYIAIPFELIPPKEAAKEVPRAQIRIDNVGRELTQELEALPPGAELTARIACVYRAQPDIQFRGFTAPMSGIQADPISISATIGSGEVLRRSAVNVRYDPVTAPGLFPD